MNKEFKNKVCTCDDFSIKHLCIEPIDCFGCKWLKDENIKETNLDNKSVDEEGTTEGS
jgi:hypothetical protein